MINAASQRFFIRKAGIFYKAIFKAVDWTKAKKNKGAWDALVWGEAIVEDEDLKALAIVYGLDFTQLPHLPPTRQITDYAHGGPAEEAEKELNTPVFPFVKSLFPTSSSILDVRNTDVAANILPSKEGPEKDAALYVERLAALRKRGEEKDLLRR